jgi:hypothetical protein
MVFLLSNLPTLTISAIYCAYSAYRQAQDRRRRLLHERVAYLLWVMAQQVDEPAVCAAGGHAPTRRF